LTPGLAEREAAAWQAYIEAVQRCPAHDLDAMEPSYWRQLRAELRIVDRMRTRERAA
jgi:hypothetical protein